MYTKQNLTLFTTLWKGFWKKFACCPGCLTTSTRDWAKNVPDRERVGDWAFFGYFLSGTHVVLSELL